MSRPACRDCGAPINHIRTDLGFVEVIDLDPLPATAAITPDCLEHWRDGWHHAGVGSRFRGYPIHRIHQCQQLQLGDAS